MANSTPSPTGSSSLISCKMREMFSYSSASFSESQACRKCSLFIALEAKLSELGSIKASAASQQQLTCADQTSLAAVGCCPTATEHPGSQDGWVAVRKKCRPKQKPVVHHQPLHVANRFSPLSDTPTKKPSLVISGYYAVLRYVKPTPEWSPPIKITTKAIMRV